MTPTTNITVKRPVLRREDYCIINEEVLPFRTALWEYFEKLTKLEKENKELTTLNRQELIKLKEQQWNIYREQLTLTDEQKQKFRNKGEYHKAEYSDRWACNECGVKGDRFYAQLHPCPAFLDPSFKKKTKKELALEAAEERAEGNESLFDYLSEVYNNDLEEGLI